MDESHCVEPDQERTWCSWREARVVKRDTDPGNGPLADESGSTSTACRILYTYLKLSGAPACPRCDCERHYELRDGRYRCAACQYTYHELTGRWLSHCRLPCDTWLQLVRLFEASATIDQMRDRTGIARSTLLKAVHTIRLAIFTETPGAESWVDARGDTVFGLVDYRESALADPIGGMAHDELLDGARWRDSAGGVVLAGPCEPYGAALFVAPESELSAHRQSLARGEVFRSQRSPFWQFAVPYFKARHGVRPERFPLYLKEALFRYNNRNRELGPQILRCLCSLDHGMAPMP